MSEISIIVVDGKPRTIAGNSDIYPVYDIPSIDLTTTDVLYNKKCAPPNNRNPTGFGSAKEISSDMTFTISGNYTDDGTTIKTSSNCAINIKFFGGVSNTDLGKITIPSGSTISGTGTPISSLQNLIDKSLTKATLAINITFTIWDADVDDSNVLTAKLTIGFARYYNHLTSTAATPSIPGYTNYAPGQFLIYLGPPPPPTPPPWPVSSTTPQVLKGTISGAAGTFNNAITFTSQPGFTHIVHPSE